MGQTDNTNPNGADNSGATQDPQSQTGDSGQSGAPNGAPASQDSPKWVYQLSGDLQKHPQVIRHQSPSELVQEYLGFAERADRLVELPGDDADEEARTAFFDRLRPKTPEEYALPRPPEGVPFDEEEQAEFRTLAHEVGLTPDQAKRLAEWDLHRALTAQQEAIQARDAGMTALKSEWGDSFDGNIQEVQVAFREIAQKLGDESLAQRMVESGYGNDADLVKMFHGIWQMIKPDRLSEGSTDGGSPDIASSWYPETNFGD